MSDLIPKTQLSDSKDCPATAHKPVCQRITTREAQIGEGLTIRRALPNRDRRMIGAWCFLDHFGPLNLKTNGLNVPPHPHLGLQTFTWTVHGEILHRDSLGSKQVIKPGQVNLMTAGKGISHSEESLPDSILHGVQLWIALPDNKRFMDPEFIHYESVPHIEHEGLFIHILAGDFLGKHSPSKVYSPLVGLELDAQDNTETVLPLTPSFEYGILPLLGEIEVEGETIDQKTLLYLGCGRKQLTIKLEKGAKILVIGGEPFQEEILIWWNFVARTEAELTAAVAAWNDHTQFGEVKGYVGEWATAPELSVHIRK